AGFHSGKFLRCTASHLYFNTISQLIHCKISSFPQVFPKLIPNSCTQRRSILAVIILLKCKDAIFIFSSERIGGILIKKPLIALGLSMYTFSSRSFLVTSGAMNLDGRAMIGLTEKCAPVLFCRILRSQNADAWHCEIG